MTSKPSSTKAKAARSKPAGKAKPRAKPGPIRTKLAWRGLTIAVSLTPDRFVGNAHLEVQVLAPKGMPIPISETGYSSHFVLPDQVKEAGGAAAYVRQWLEQEARGPAYRKALDRWRQLDLFEPGAIWPRRSR